MKKRLLCLLTALVLLLAPTPTAAKSADACADALYSLGLFRGSDTGYNLDQTATRVQISVTLLRLLGKEAKAQIQNNAHPFGDVPAWAGASIGWLYENYLVNGTSDTRFGADDTASRKQFVAMLLRALGYSDKNSRDFSYEYALAFAKSIGLTDNAYDAVLSRAEMVSLSYAALCQPLRIARRTLARKLCDERVFGEDIGIATGVLSAAGAMEYFPSVEENLGAMQAEKRGGALKIIFDNPPESYGVRLFYAEEGMPYAEILTSGNVSSSTEIEYRSLDPATYLGSFTVRGLAAGKTYSFVALKTSSTGPVYDTYGKTAVLTVTL